jgi:hypothetical protein
VVAENFSNKAANLICRELELEYAVDWVRYWDVLNAYKNDKFVFLHLLDLHCDDMVEKFDDCSYNMTLKSHKTRPSPYIILSCNPKPGETSS